MASYVLNEEKMFSDIADGIAIVINSETGIYYGMNNFGTNVFENILNGVSAENILAAIQAMPGAPEDVPARLEAFIKALVDNELVLEGGAGNGVAALDGETAAKDGFALKVSEYNDAQELLLADPIHEVKPGTGWQPDKDALNPDEKDAAARAAKLKG
ncbi:hypothetical protein FACS1894151_03280 [Spirochaetia bacterium]|nr:hypothetical protein FACS1894151_03280 [Spirochaetia bacterium]